MAHNKPQVPANALKKSLLEQQQPTFNLSSYITSHFEWGIT